MFRCEFVVWFGLVWKPRHVVFFSTGRPGAFYVQSACGASTEEDNDTWFVSDFAHAMPLN